METHANTLTTWMQNYNVLHQMLQLPPIAGWMGHGTYLSAWIQIIHQIITHFFIKFIANKYLWNRRNKWTQSSLPFSQSFIPLKVTDVMWWNIGHILSRLLLFHNERHRKPEKHVLKKWIYLYRMQTFLLVGYIFIKDQKDRQNENESKKHINLCQRNQI